MINDNSLQKFIDDILIVENNKKIAEHEPSGLLSASWLFQPVRFQVMKTIGVPRKDMEPYVLGKFNRGDDVEDWLVEKMTQAKLIIETQKPVTYRNVVGLVDAVVDSNAMYFKKGLIPHEIKSVTNAKLKRITSTEVDYHYKLQGGFYALAMGTEFYAIDVISAEDLRVNTYVFAVKDIKADIEQIITTYDQAIEAWNTNKTLPAFVVNPKVPWTSNLQYAPFTEEWITMGDEELVTKLDLFKAGLDLEDQEAVGYPDKNQINA